MKEKEKKIRCSSGPFLWLKSVTQIKLALHHCTLRQTSEEQSGGEPGRGAERGESRGRTREQERGEPCCDLLEAAEGEGLSAAGRHRVSEVKFKVIGTICGALCRDELGLLICGATKHSVDVFIWGLFTSRGDLVWGEVDCSVISEPW